MGQRANLIVIASGQRELYYSHWRANTLDRDLFWGPAAATAFARQQLREAEGAELLDEVWSEGGAVIDHDAKLLLWYGGEDTLFDVPLRRVHLQMMRELWTGWSVRWASEGVADLATYLGVNLDAVLRPDDGAPSSASGLLEPPPDPSWISIAVTSKVHGKCQVFTNDASVAWVLGLGPELLERLRNATGSSSFDWSSRSQGFPTGGVHIDWDAREIGYWVAEAAPALRARTEASFRGWAVTCWGDEFEAQLRAVPALSFPAYDERTIARALVDHLLTEDHDRSNLVPEAVAALRYENAEINPLALRDGVLALSVAARRRILEERFPLLMG